MTKERLQKLRGERKAVIDAATARVKEQKKAIGAIKAALEKGGRTVPELASATGIPGAEVLWYLATLKKYGRVLEGEKDGGYFRYRLAPEGREED
jgi:DNA-binding IclR family transcriptional regulator